MSDYWERRAARDMWQYMEDAEKTAEEIKKLYQRGYRYLSEGINQIFERFRDAHNLTDEEARQLLNTMQSPTDLHELKEKLKQTTDGEEKAELLAKLESAAYQHRIQRFQSLVNQIDTIMHQTYKAELKIAEDACQRLAEDVYYKTIYQVQKQTGLGFSFSLIDDAAIKKAMSLKWYGKNYSERIWVNANRLAEKLKEELMVNFITGRTNREAAESVQFEFAKGMQNARRLVRTESCYLANQMEMQSYEECEIEKYRFVATLDLRTSDICRELDGKVFRVSEQKPGKNCPPMHPYCRSTTVCDIGEEELARMARRARNPETGRTETVPANMTYKQWYDQKVKGHPEAELNEKKIKHQSADKKQYQRYKEILGDDVPKTLDAFQDMKYTEPEKWELFREYAKTVDKGMISPLSGFENYTKMHDKIQTDIVGMTTSDGIQVTGQSKHFLERVVGTMQDPKTGRLRSGVAIKEIAQAIKAPLDIRPVKVDYNGGRSQKYIGEKATVTINPDTGNLIQCNPTENKLARRMKHD